MKNLKRADGVDSLLKQLPQEYHYWYKFNNIISLNYENIFDYEKAFDYIPCINMILATSDNKYTIELTLKDVHGDFFFSILNGFFGGLEIEDHYHNGYESGSNFHVTCFEMGGDALDLWCRDISVKLINGC